MKGMTVMELMVIRAKMFDLMCKGLLIAYTDEQKKIFEMLTGRSFDSITTKDLQAKDEKVWVALVNIRNEQVKLKADGTLDMSKYKEFDVDKYIEDSIDELLDFSVPEE